VAASPAGTPLLRRRLTFSSFQTTRISEPEQPEVTVAGTRSDFLEKDDESGWSMLKFRRRSRLGGSAP
jgi:hypothetical protein